MTINLDCVTTDRGGIIENRHYVHVVVVDLAGNLLYSAGDLSRLTIARSAAKPAQAQAVFETGAFRQSGFNEADLALMCASNSGEERHVARARAMLAKATADESRLRCGGRPALSDALNRAWIRTGYGPTGICNNCPVKHAGMPAYTRAVREDLADDYNLPEHPMQVQSAGPSIASQGFGRAYALFAGVADPLDADQQA
ncbi:hypothetical protein DL769_008894 [Monosporascus sp. CRB-8-3]|nr:hypothetical protein DL769_008894 [Monosporascus sp. CRB-8-3]